jgi:hypothetical protein
LKVWSFLRKGICWWDVPLPIHAQGLSFVTPLHTTMKAMAQSSQDVHKTLGIGRKDRFSASKSGVGLGCTSSKGSGDANTG